MNSDVKKHDDLYADPLAEIVDFRFDESVVNVFPDMINRSVPGYAEVIVKTGILAGLYSQDNSRCYDLGCSLGAVTLSMLQYVHHKNCRVVSVDNSEAMIASCREHLDAIEHDIPVDLVCADLADVEISNASVVVMNYTLQFIAPEKRQALLKKIYDGLLPGGVLILSEKIAFEDETEGLWQEQMHHEFKRANGYTDLEISQKRTALEKVLIPETRAVHVQRLREAGFGAITRWFQCFNFISLIARK